jgi:RNA polymerase sigma factor (sigma-70 family)
VTAVQESDLSLVQRAREGDGSAFSALYERHQSLVQRVVGRYVVTDEAPDLCQDAFIKAWERLPRARPDTTFSSWVAQVAARTALDFVRSSHAKLMRTGGLPSDHPVRGLLARKLQYEPDTYPDPEERLLAAERGELLDELLATLRPFEQEQLRLMADGHTMQEIARHQIRPQGGIKGALFRSRAMLAREILADQGRYEPLDLERAARALGNKLSAFETQRPPPRPSLSEGDS